jgi:hypothetical protein
MATQACVRCGTQVANAEIIFSDVGGVCTRCSGELDADAAAARARDPIAIAGFVAALLPFFLFIYVGDGAFAFHIGLHFGTGGVVALIGGIAALVLGAVAANNARKLDAHRTRHLQIAGAVLVLGLIQLIRGLV